MYAENVELDAKVVGNSYHDGEEEMNQIVIRVPRILQFFV